MTDDRTLDDRSIGIVLFDDFELLDVFGPAELFSRLPEEYPITYIAARPGPVRSSQGAQVIATRALDEPGLPNIMMVPGGMGTRTLVGDAEFLRRLGGWAARAKLITSICTGSAVLAAAGLLDGYRATSNKKAFEWVTTNGPDVTWVPQARWVHDRNRWTSSGVAAGMDMAAALIAHLSGPSAAARATREIELEVHADASWDPFAAHYGLV